MERKKNKYLYSSRAVPIRCPGTSLREGSDAVAEGGGDESREGKRKKTLEPLSTRASTLMVPQLRAPA